MTPNYTIKVKIYHSWKTTAKESTNVQKVLRFFSDQEISQTYFNFNFFWKFDFLTLFTIFVKLDGGTWDWQTGRFVFAYEQQNSPVCLVHYFRSFRSFNGLHEIIWVGLHPVVNNQKTFVWIMLTTRLNRNLPMPRRAKLIQWSLTSSKYTCSIKEGRNLRVDLFTSLVSKEQVNCEYLFDLLLQQVNFKCPRINFNLQTRYVWNFALL